MHKLNKLWPYLILAVACVTIVLATSGDYDELWFFLMLLGPMIGLVTGAFFAFVWRLATGPMSERARISMLIFAVVVTSAGYMEEGLFGVYRYTVQAAQYDNKLSKEGYHKIVYDKHSVLYVNEEKGKIEERVKYGTSSDSFATFSQLIYDREVDNGNVEPGLKVNTVIKDNLVYIVGTNEQTQETTRWKVVPTEYSWTLQKVDN